MEIWLWPGPRFWTAKPATLAATSSIFSMPRSRMTSSVGAVTETGVLKMVVSRFMAVTVTSSEILNSRAKSAFTVAPSPTLWSLTVTGRKPCTSAETV